MISSRSEYVLLRERRYHLRVWGDDTAPPLFFLHGWGDVSASFQFVVDAMPGRWKVVAPDWRGFGLSQWNDGAYWFPDYIADLDALLELYSPCAAAQIAGHSLGGIVASLYAGIRPERVSRLATLEGFALWTQKPGETPLALARWLEHVRANDSAFRSYARREDFAARLIADNPRLRPERAAFIAEHSLHAVDGGFVFAADPRHRWPNPVLYPLAEAMACWQRITAPTLWIGGRDSRVMRSFAESPDDYRQRMACFAQVDEALIDHCGHNMHHDQPEELGKLLAAFFSAPAGI